MRPRTKEKNKILIDLQKLNISKHGPNQPVIAFPLDEIIRSKLSKQQNGFVNTWYSEHIYIEYSNANDQAYGFTCVMFFRREGR